MSLCLPCSPSTDLLSLKGHNYDSFVNRRCLISNDGNGKVNIGCLIVGKDNQYLLCGWS